MVGRGVDRDAVGELVEQAADAGQIGVREQRLAAAVDKRADARLDRAVAVGQRVMPMAPSTDRTPP